MTALTNDRQVTAVPSNSPYGYGFAQPANGITTYYGQILTIGADNLLRPAVTSAAAMSGSVCVGVSNHSSFAIAASTPLPEGGLQYRFGTFNFANDSGSPVTTGTLPGTLLYAVDDQTLSLSSNTGQRAVFGRLQMFVSGAAYPVVASVGPTTSISGSTF